MAEIELNALPRLSRVFEQVGKSGENLLQTSAPLVCVGMVGIDDGWRDKDGIQLLDPLGQFASI